MNDRDLPVDRDLRHSSTDDFWMDEDDDDFGGSDDDIRSAVARRPLLSSATDLLISWLPQPEDSGDTVTSNEIWDRYFGRPGGERLSVPHKPHTRRSVRHPETIRPSAAALEPWEIEAAESSVDCLFTFLRALEKCDISAAMACVSKEYHVVDDDGEIDRPRLQLYLEKLVDEWRGAGVQISTTEVPDPICHPAGVLISGTIQIDFGVRSPEMASQLISRIFVFSKTSRGEWRLSAIAKVPRVAK
jgi:hypothetical protein